MTALRTALAAAGLGAAVWAAGAPAALAEERPAHPKAASFGFSVSPAAVRPGGAIDLTVTNCTRHEATAESAVFDRVVLGMPGELQSARTTVDTDARPGTEYEVRFTCGGQSGTATLDILSASASPTQTGSARPTASSTVLPTRGAQAGVGGTQSNGDTMLWAGAGLTTAAVTGAVLVAARRRTGRHR
ncbi:hypothetical protein [Streptomyces marincola]|uniref:Lipoprotein n=2 Tax=Streptomyces marincola TaxID=2878388 RepID=A0A1W7D6H7_9ACTN|nr:hypothetical protein [Streptomyces marincola]ARQ72688.1 hypothetical protein CAG99_27330 [Streptomyces marincola]UCM86481.1 hypothetical protein LC193_00140 [Streptomyces marincola]